MAFHIWVAVPTKKEYHSYIEWTVGAKALFVAVPTKKEYHSYFLGLYGFK